MAKAPRQSGCDGITVWLFCLSVIFFFQPHLLPAAGQLLVRGEIGRGSLVARLAYEHGRRKVKPGAPSDWHEKLEGLPRFRELGMTIDRKSS